MAFANEPVAVHDLPELRDDEFVPVEPSYLKVSLTAMGLFGLVVAAAGIALVSFGPGDTIWPPVAITAALLGLTAVAALFRVIEVRHMAYQIREHDLSYRSGVLVRTVATIPFVRVQHARIRQGPVQRRFDLATVEVNSAGPDLRIAGLSTATAERLKAMVVDRAGDLVEEL